MSQQYPPQQPGWGQQPNQPYPQQPGWVAPPPPPKKTPVGMIVGLGCLGIVVLFVIIGAIGAIAGSDSGSSKSTSVAADNDAAKDTEAEKTDDKPAAEEEPTEKPTEEKAKEDTKEDTKKETKKPVVTFKVWGTAPAGVLGTLDITYGSDSDTRKGKFTDGKFTATLPLDDDAMYFTVMAQLQGEGDINCSVTVEGHTEKAHAAGGYNICHAQANGGLLGDWD